MTNIFTDCTLVRIHLFLAPERSLKTRTLYYGLFRRRRLIDNYWHCLPYNFDDEPLLVLARAMAVASMVLAGLLAMAIVTDFLCMSIIMCDFSVDIFRDTWAKYMVATIAVLLVTMALTFCVQPAICQATSLWGPSTRTDWDIVEVDCHLAWDRNLMWEIAMAFWLATGIVLHFFEVPEVCRYPPLATDGETVCSRLDVTDSIRGDGDLSDRDEISVHVLDDEDGNYDDEGEQADNGHV